MNSIQVAAEKSGLTPDAIRVWERRYQAVSPQRSPANQRIYSDDDIYRLTLLRKATEAGKRISKVANLPINELEELVSNQRISKDLPINDKSTSSYSHNYLRVCLDNILTLDSFSFERNLQKALVEMGMVRFLKDLIHPLMVNVGNLWEKGNVRTCQEHFATAAVRSFLGRYIVTSNTDPAGPRIIIATLPDHQHELGATMAALTASLRGWDAIYLGPSVPIEEIVFAAECKEAKAVAIGIGNHNTDPQIEEHLTNLRRLLPEQVKILIGGAGHQSYNDTLSGISALCSNDLSAFSQHLDQIKEG